MNGEEDKMERLVYVCRHVFENSNPVLLVCHESDGDWQFLCGGTHNKEEPIVVGMEHILDRDRTLLVTLKIPPGWEAERRDVSSMWVYREKSEF